MQVRQLRLSLTFAKLEADIATLSAMVLEFTSGDPDHGEEVAFLYRNRENDFKYKLEDGFSSHEVLRGLEEPDPIDDKSYWKSRDKVFGLYQQSEDE